MAQEHAITMESVSATLGRIPSFIPLWLPTFGASTRPLSLGVPMPSGSSSLYFAKGQTRVMKNEGLCMVMVMVERCSITGLIAARQHTE